MNIKSILLTSISHTCSRTWLCVTGPQVRFSRAKLDLKEKQYLEFADALREFSPKHPGIAQAQAAAAELREVRQRLDEQRRGYEDSIKKEEKSTSLAHERH